MSFKQAEIKKKANVYHDGKVTSRTVITTDGEMKTLGVMLPGTYRFSTNAAETMELTQGACRVRIGEGQDWQEFIGGQKFEVPANSSFEVEVSDLLDYVCHFHQ